jgi:hypothetical protein
MFRATSSIVSAVSQLRGKETPDHASRFRKPLSYPAVNILVLHITIMEEKSIIDYWIGRMNAINHPHED